MEELRLLIEMVSKLPTMAIWVLLGIFAYKVAIVGSIYGVIRLGIVKLHDYLTRRKTEVKEVLIDGKLQGWTITAHVDELCEQIKRVRGKGLTTDSEYIHRDSVKWLREAIDDKVAKDVAEGKVWGSAARAEHKSREDFLRHLNGSLSQSSAQLASAMQNNSNPFGFGP